MFARTTSKLCKRRVSTSNSPLALGNIAPKEMANTQWDAVVIGGGHNGLTAANYLAKGGKSKVLVLERRHIVGGAAITEEMVPGFKFSRASYVCSLLRPQIIRDLDLARHGFKALPRDPSSFTPMLDGRYLLLGRDQQKNLQEIAKFSKKDAENFPRFEHTLERLSNFFEHFIDRPPPEITAGNSGGGGLSARLNHIGELIKSGVHVAKLGKDLPLLLELMTAPAIKTLNRYFESEPLISTLATDSIIGANVAPSTPGSGYVLFHHVMGETNGVKGVWAHVEGGMGAISRALALSAIEKGVKIATESPVAEITLDGAGKASGVLLENGTRIQSKLVLSNATPHVTFNRLLPKNVQTSSLPQEFREQISQIDYSSPVFKINVALNRVPDFKAFPSRDGQAGPQHRGTVHLCENTEQIETGFRECTQGLPSSRPIVEMNIPTSLDHTIAPPGKHIALLFCQYAPNKLAPGMSWDDPKVKDNFVQSVFNVCEEYAPGFRDSIIGYDALSPLDLENIIGLTGGNIFHGAMGLDQLFWSRPARNYSSYRSPIPGLYMCGSGAHPGGGVMGAPGRNAALVALSENK